MTESTLFHTEISNYKKIQLQIHTTVRWRCTVVNAWLELKGSQFQWEVLQLYHCPVSFHCCLLILNNKEMTTQEHMKSMKTGKIWQNMLETQSNHGKSILSQDLCRTKRAVPTFQGFLDIFSLWFITWSLYDMIFTLGKTQYSKLSFNLEASRNLETQ
jgi:hypothetical protein